MNEVKYNGVYQNLHGIEMSRAYASTLELSFDVRGGLFIRQVHHWAALLFVAAIVAHMFRTFFTGAFRKPRETNWTIGVIIALLAGLVPCRSRRALAQSRRAPRRAARYAVVALYRHA